MTTPKQKPGQAKGTALVPVMTPTMQVRHDLIQGMSEGAKQFAESNRELVFIEKKVIEQLKREFKRPMKTRMHLTDLIKCYKDLQQGASQRMASHLAVFDRLQGVAGFGDGWLDEKDNIDVNQKGLANLDRDVSKEAEELLKALSITKAKRAEEEKAQRLAITVDYSEEPEA